MMNPVKEFEDNFAHWFKSNRAFSFWKGRVVMYAILKACGVIYGDEIIMQFVLPHNFKKKPQNSKGCNYE